MYTMTLVLGEIIVARIIKWGEENFGIDVPGSYTVPHIITNNRYTTEKEAFKAAYRLVPNECQESIGVITY